MSTWTQHPDLVEFYSEHRGRPDELYESERRFLPWLAEGSQSVLDVGCAAGGFAGIWRHWNPGIAYAGVDVSEPLVDAARRLHPDCEFTLADCADGLPFEDERFDAVQALGWLHWEPRWEPALREMWRVSAGRLFFDVRLAESPQEGEQRIALAGDWDGETTVPYLCLGWERFAERLLDLAPAAVYAHGYLGKASDTVTGVQGEICFATFVLERGAPRTPVVCADMPLEWPAKLGGDVRPAAELERLAPREVPAA